MSRPASCSRWRSWQDSRCEDAIGGEKVVRTSHFTAAAAGFVLGCSLIACNHGGGAVVDGGTDTMTCDPTCLSRSWWLGRSSDCSVVCMGNSNWTECTHTDCEVIEASRYSAGTRTSLAPMLYSSEARSFYLIGSSSMQSYSAGGDCNLQIGSGSSEHFSCTDVTLVLPTATLELASPEQAAALDSVSAPGRYTY